MPEVEISDDSDPMILYDLNEAAEDAIEGEDD